MFGSFQSFLILILGATIIYINQSQGSTNRDLLIQAFGFGLLAYNANCLVNGNCGSWSWLTISLPILFSILFIMDFYYGPFNGMSTLPNQSAAQQNQIQIAEPVNSTTTNEKNRIVDVPQGSVVLTGESEVLAEANVEKGEPFQVSMRVL
jgi:hypothetical protein